MRPPPAAENLAPHHRDDAGAPHRIQRRRVAPSAAGATGAPRCGAVRIGRRLAGGSERAAHPARAGELRHRLLPPAAPPLERTGPPAVPLGAAPALTVQPCLLGSGLTQELIKGHYFSWYTSDKWNNNPCRKNHLYLKGNATPALITMTVEFKWILHRKVRDAL